MARNPTLDRFFEQEFRQFRYQPVNFCRRVLEIDPHDGQAQWLRSSVACENALTTGNRYGKSFVAAMKLIWRAVYQKGWTADVRLETDKTGQAWAGMNIGPTQDQAKIVFGKMVQFLNKRRAQWLVQELRMSPFPTITFFNGATVQARSTAGNGERLLGLDLDFINWDEAAREKKFEAIRDDVLRMRLVDRRGMLDYTTTGNGRNPYGLYFLTGLPGDRKDPNLYSQTGTSYENSHIPKDILDRNSARMSDRLRRQNIGGEIVDAGGGFFSIEDLEAAVNDDLTRQMLVHFFDEQEDAIGHVEIYYGRDIEIGQEGLPWHNQFPNHRYLHVWDLAKKKDYVVGSTLDTSGDRMKQVEFQRFRKMDWGLVYDRIRERHNRYRVSAIGDGPAGSSRTVVDSTGVGDVAVDALKDINAEGFIFSKPSKDDALANLQSALSLREFEMPMIPVQYDEMKFYEDDDKDLIQDTVMTLAIAAKCGRRRQVMESWTF